MRSILAFSLLLAVLLLPSASAGAVVTSTPSSTDDATENTASDEQTAASVFDSEGLTDEDLATDLEAEALPTANPIAYWWENLRNNVISVFTFNAEKKAAFYRFRLHELDRKMAACADLGDEKCVDKIQAAQKQLQQRTEAYIAKQQELGQAALERIQAWRQHRTELLQQFRNNKATNTANSEERLRQREENRAEAIQRRQETLNNIQTRREQNRDQLIKLRSERLNNNLNNTRAQVNQAQEQYNQALGEN
ncbi:MAG: hypothetical protein Q8P73_00935 [bacterium]|nr:hypothetical protein [bacterium]